MLYIFVGIIVVPPLALFAYGFSHLLAWAFIALVEFFTGQNNGF